MSPLFLSISALFPVPFSILHLFTNMQGPQLFHTCPRLPAANLSDLYIISRNMRDAPRNSLRCLHGPDSTMEGSPHQCPGIHETGSR